MKHKFLKITLLFAMLMLFTPLIVSAASSGTCGADDDNLTWTLDDNGTLTISGYDGKAIKVDGTITYSGGTQNFDTDDTKINVGIESAKEVIEMSAETIYDLNGRKVSLPTKGVYIVKKSGQVRKQLIE